MEDLRFEELARQSRLIHGKKHVLPVAAWLEESKDIVVRAPEVGRGLDGRLQSGEVLQALERLCSFGAIEELPHPGAPHPRQFEVRMHPYWQFVAAIAADITQQ